MSWLLLNSGRLLAGGCGGAGGGLNVVKVLAANSGQLANTSSSVPTPTSTLFQGRVFTAKYLHTLQQRKDDKGQAMAPSLLGNINNVNKSLVVLNKRPMSGGDHVTLWTAERIVSGVLVPLLPAALLMPCAPLDHLVAFSLVLHSHWGIEAIVADYVRPSVFGEAIPKIAMGLVYGLSAMALGGLAYFNYADVGLGQAVRMLWKL